MYSHYNGVCPEQALNKTVIQLCVQMSLHLQLILEAVCVYLQLKTDRKPKKLKQKDIAHSRCAHRLKTPLPFPVLCQVKNIYHIVKMNYSE